MTLMDVVSWMQQRAGFIAIRPIGALVALNPQGKLICPSRGRNAYAILGAMDVLAIDWEVYTPAQLEARAAEIAG